MRVERDRRIRGGSRVTCLTIIYAPLSSTHMYLLILSAEGATESGASGFGNDIRGRKIQVTCEESLSIRSMHLGVQWQKSE
jgi:hypothetical protein